MLLFQEMLGGLLANENVNINFPQLQINANEIIHLECYKALSEIKLILENDDLDDKECFVKIEEIVCLFEKLGSSCGNRHDFG
ncbi:MAG: hypothetical protein RRY03_00835 [Oscillospiraceae bacterium]